MARAAIVLQARMGSRRLPGKVLTALGPRTLLDHAVSRLATSGLPVIVATTSGREDDVVAEEARRLGAGVFRGDASDVLQRFVDAAHAYEVSLVVRATADNPFVDAEGPRRVATLMSRLGADYVLESGLPVGAAVEAVTTEALERAAALAAEPFDREHVTTFIRRDGRFRPVRSMTPAVLRRPELRLTVDTPEDLEYARRLWARLDSRTGLPTLSAVIAAAITTPRPHAVAELARRGA
jgi:spore coat polysaccharide biosynthesis protein SpsF (cytidylyltransferase family)